jgi:hypothetical protein
MRKIPPKLLEEMLSDPYYSKCARKKEGNCKGRVTLEHALIFAGKQVNEKYAIVPICAYHHEVDQYQDGGGMNKELHVAIALSRASDLELRMISKAIDYTHMRDVLCEKYCVKDGIML